MEESRWNLFLIRWLLINNFFSLNFKNIKKVLKCVKIIVKNNFWSHNTENFLLYHCSLLQAHCIKVDVVEIQITW